MRLRRQYSSNSKRLFLGPAVGVRAVMGKGGMGRKTLAALKEHGAVYLNAIGGAAQFWARLIDKALDEPARIRRSGGDVAPEHARFRGHRDHGRSRQHPARGCQQRNGSAAGGAAESVGCLCGCGGAVVYIVSDIKVDQKPDCDGSGRHGLRVELIRWLIG
jgi:hypothetical protein